MARTLTLKDVAALVGGAVVGPPERTVCGVAAPDTAGGDALRVVWRREALAVTPHGAALLTLPGWIPAGAAGVEVADPRVALALLLREFTSPERPRPGVHPSAVIDPSASVDPTAHVGPLCVVSAEAVIGPEAVLEAQVFVGRRAVVGRGSRLEPLVVLYEDASIGRDCLIHAGAMVGCDGFGFTTAADGQRQKIPQVGRVMIEDDVELGPLVTVDRATLGETRIGRGTKIDAHVHVAHNCRVGSRCLLVAFTGLAGSVTVGDDVVLAARAGVAPHVTIGSGATIAGGAGVTADVPPGATVSGFPAQDHRRELRQQALLRKLPELFKRIRRRSKT